jgi:hypothetical protein
MTSHTRQTSPKCPKSTMKDLNRASIPKPRPFQQPIHSVMAGIDDTREVQRNIMAHAVTGTLSQNDYSVPRQGEKPRVDRTSTSSDVDSALLPARTADTRAAAPVTYFSIRRPWQEANAAASSSSTSMTGASPMERLMQETVREQPWNGAMGIHVGRFWERDAVGRVDSTTEEHDSDVVVETGSY